MSNLPLFSNDSVVAKPDVTTASEPQGWFRHANPATDLQATPVTVDFLNYINGNIDYLLTQKDIPVDLEDMTQIYTATLSTGWLTEVAANALYVKLSGSEMTGLLTLSGNPSTDMHAATKQYADTKLPLSGGNLTGDLSITKPSASLTLKGNSSQYRYINFTSEDSGNKNRWQIQVNNAGEGGSSTGSNFEIVRWDDFGNGSAVFQIDRQTGKTIHTVESIHSYAGGGAGQIRLASGTNKAWLLHNNGTDFYFLQTDSGSGADGLGYSPKSYNAARPFRISNATGHTTLSGLTIANDGVNPDPNITLATTPSNYWHAANKGYVDGTVYKNENGYVTLPNGLMMQWGKHGYTSGSGTPQITVWFPTAFPNACLNIQITRVENVNAILTGMPQAHTIYSDKFTFIDSDTSPNAIFWTAIGY